MFIFGKENFVLKSEGIVNNIIEEKYGGKGSDIIKNVGSRSIPLEWSDPPKGTKSFAIIMEDRDAVPGEVADQASRDVVDAIGSVATGRGDKPVEPVVIESVTITE